MRRIICACCWAPLDGGEYCEADEIRKAAMHYCGDCVQKVEDALRKSITMMEKIHSEERIPFALLMGVIREASDILGEETDDEQEAAEWLCQYGKGTEHLFGPPISHRYNTRNSICGNVVLGESDLTDFPPGKRRCKTCERMASTLEEG